MASSLNGLLRVGLALKLNQVKRATRSYLRDRTDQAKDTATSYTVAVRPDTGLYNGKLGVWLFLASEVMLFGALFTAYLFMRLGADPGMWPQHVQSIPLGFTNTRGALTSTKMDW